jgi:hypothetical protein
MYEELPLRRVEIKRKSPGCIHGPYPISEGAMSIYHFLEWLMVAKGMADPGRST